MIVWIIPTTPAQGAVFRELRWGAQPERIFAERIDALPPTRTPRMGAKIFPGFSEMELQRGRSAVDRADLDA